MTVRRDAQPVKYFDLGLAAQNMMIMAQFLGVSTLPLLLPKVFLILVYFTYI
jgi:nitroreductase